MKDLWQAYQKGERQTGVLLVGLGALAVLGGLIMLRVALRPIFQGMAWTLIAMGALSILKGMQTLLGIYRRSRRWNRLERDDPETLLDQERQSMRYMLRQMRQMQLLDLLIFLAGIGLALAGSIGNLGFFAVGNGVALSFQAGVLLAIDLFSGLRNGLYYEKLP